MGRGKIMLDWDPTPEEKEYTRQAVSKLESAPWAKPLLCNLEKQEGMSTSTLPLMFEVRVAYALFRRGLTVEYEAAAGVGEKTADFRIQGDPTWIIEVVSLCESDAVK